MYMNLATVARLLPDGRAWHAQQKAALAARGPADTVAALTALPQRGPGRTRAVRAAAQACLTYLLPHRDQLDYPTARRDRLPIGTGRVESACRFVVQQRCKQAGMCWDPAHAQAILQARCTHLNGEWDQMLARYQLAQQAA